MEVCPKCRGSGWILIKNNDGTEVARACECREVEKAKRLLEKSGISDEFQNKTFGNFNDKGMPLLIKAKKISIDYCKQFPDIRNTRKNSILFMGQVGSGKTHLSMAICNNLMNIYKVGVLYMAYREEVVRLKQIVNNEDSYNKSINRFKDCPVLMIDDLLKGKNTEADNNILFEIINYRYLNNLPMVISTEKMQEELLDYDEGTMSRVIEMSRGHMVEIVGREYNYRLSC